MRGGSPGGEAEASGLAACVLFRDVRADQVERLERVGRVRDHDAGETVLREGDPGDGLYVILSGRVRVDASVPGGEGRVLSVLGAGDFFGEMSIVDDEPRSASVVAETELRLIRLSKPAVHAVLRQSPELGLALLREVSRRQRDFNRRHLEEILQAERLATIGRFARSIVHDLKGPLNVIGIAAELYAHPDSTMDMRLASVQRIRRQVERISAMVGELLEFSREGAVRPGLRRTRLRPWLTELLAGLADDVRARKAILEFDEVPDLEFPVDTGRLSRVFHNLIDNAVVAMLPEGGRIVVRFREEFSRLRVEVMDEGRGVPDEIRETLFDPFVTMHRSNGTGLGLAICRRIVADHGGQIGYRDRRGGGSVFHFTLSSEAADA